MASPSTEVRYAFTLEYYDQQAELMRKYTLLYYGVDRTIEIVDNKRGKKFLRRTQYPDLPLEDIILGSVVTIFARQMKVVDYADDFTRSAFAAKSERTLALIKPDAYERMGKIIEQIQKSGLRIVNMRLVRLDDAQVEEFYAEHLEKDFFPRLAAFMTSDVTVALELVADGAIGKWRDLIGPTNTETAKATAPSSLRAQFGTDATRNACHGSDSPDSARRELDFFFGPSTTVQSVASCADGCTCCVIRPHAVRAGAMGPIIDAIIDDGFEVTGMEMFRLEPGQAAEFLEVYKGVVPEFTAMAEDLSGGPCLALEIRAENAVPAFRELCGPMDPEIARAVRPNTLRARFGVDKAHNAVHCTDLPEDGVLESQYFFGILQSVPKN